MKNLITPSVNTLRTGISLKYLFPSKLPFSFYFQERKFLLSFFTFLLLTFAFCHQAIAQADLYIKDTPSDSGVEPNPNTGRMWVSKDIWVLNEADPGYDPKPFPTGAPTWTPEAHQNPEYDDPKTGFPAYIYVRIHNRGTTASTGTERLRVYFAKSSTGLSWPEQWVDYIDNTCGADKLYGMEVTKPRKNAATASSEERGAFIDALREIATNPMYSFCDDVQYWFKQDTIHANGGGEA